MLLQKIHFKIIMIIRLFTFSYGSFLRKQMLESNGGTDSAIGGGGNCANRRKNIGNPASESPSRLWRG